MAHEFLDIERLKESLSKACSSQENITHEIFMLFQIIMRGVSRQDVHSPAYKARTKIAYISDLISQSEDFHEHQAFVDAFTRLKSWDQSAPKQRILVEAALCGLRYLIESAADDNAARGRTSQREAEFLASIKGLVGCNEKAGQQ